MTSSVPLRRRDDGACRMTGRARSVGGAGSIDRHVDPGWDHLGLRNPANRVVRADDLGAGLLAERELLRRLPADVRTEVVHDGLLAQSPEDRELE